MIKRNNKKGFTIVELVIVIAVIAILAAVLIPTFAGIIKKANQSADQQVAKNMNVALAQYSATNGKPETFEEVLAAIEDAGYVLANLNAKAEGNLYAWDKANNQIVYIDAAGEVLYQNTDFDKANLCIVISNDSIALPEGYSKENVVDMTKPAGAKALKGALEEGMSVTLSADITLEATVIIPEGSEVTLDLGGKACTTNKANPDTHEQTSEYIKVSKGATLTIKNGTFVGRGIMNNGGKVIVEEGTKLVADDRDGGGCIRNKTGGEVVINGGTFEVPNYTPYDQSSGGAVAVYNEGGKVTINGGTFTSNTDAYAIGQIDGELVINGGTFKASRGCVASNGGTVSISGGTFEVTDANSSAAHVVYTSGGTISVTGGTFTNNGGSDCFRFVSDSKGTGKITVAAGVVDDITTETVINPGESK